MKYIRVSNIKLNIDATNDDAIREAIKISGINKHNVIGPEILKMSIDARKKPSLKKIYSVGMHTNAKSIKPNKKIQILDKKPEYKYKITGTERLKHRPVVVGFGPAGMFVSYLLAINGYKPIIIEQGEMVEDRVKTVNEFWETGKLNPFSNVQFGEGGAGTFSDGKLTTGNKDKNHRIQFVLDTFVKYGAKKDIKYHFKPHIGTDYLTTIVKNMRETIEEYGGTFHFNTTVIDIREDKGLRLRENHNGKLDLKLRDEEDTYLKPDICILAIGNSSRHLMHKIGFSRFKTEKKPFAIGFRVEHKQKDINKNQYGFEDDRLGAAPYKLTYQTSEGKSVYSFCMCPGGYVINASSEEKSIVVNGMSYNDRGSENANSAIVCSVTPEEFNDPHPFFEMVYQGYIENKAYEVGDGKIPVQKYIDFKNNVKTTELGKIKPCTKGDYNLANLREILPEPVNEAIIEGIEHFGTIIDGFNDDDVILSGVESRTSSAIRILRDENLESSIKGYYPIGEGAGYAGGIVSSAVDGIRAFEKIIEKYKPF